jgi:hypothetical protein
VTGDGVATREALDEEKMGVFDVVVSLLQDLESQIL